jgi:hypothetical protein
MAEYKIGDEVVVLGRWGHPIGIYPIIDVTPSGMVRVDFAEEYKPLF